MPPPSDATLLTSAPPSAPQADGPLEVWREGSEAAHALGLLEQQFGQPFFLLDTASDAVHGLGPGCLEIDLHQRLGLCDAVARHGEPEVIEDFSPLLCLAAPLLIGNEPSELVAISTFLTTTDHNDRQLAAAARALGADPDEAASWAAQREAWNPRAVINLAKAITTNAKQRASAAQQQSQVAEISSHLLSTFEELNMLHRLTERLSIASSEAELGSQAIQWLADVVPVESIAIVHRAADNQPHTAGAVDCRVELTFGPCPLEEDEVGLLIERLGVEAHHSCVVLNASDTQAPDWELPAVRELISVPIRSGDRALGWVLAFNHTGGRRDNTFGTVEASLVSSVAAILGVHAGNCRLYAEQKEFFSAMVRALSSAIDAKDPYTSGHSDRVAQLAVTLADELGCDATDRHTIYLAGLLHDIGKIGIEDQVLRKVGRLTDAEYEHIKTHPALGHKILSGIKQLDPVLPIVLHHHEAWDGSGYPAGLKGEECPRLARIVAVADAVDAMSSDRPYRSGMPDDKLDAILRQGAGKQWDAEAVDAVFRVREKVRGICQAGRLAAPEPVPVWRI